MVHIVLALALATQAGADTAVVKDLEQMEQQLNAMWKKGDCDGWGRIIAAEWSVIHIDANVVTKAQALQMCRAKEPPIEELTVDDVSVRPYGDMAVVTGRTLVRIGGASPLTIRLRFTDVFVRRSGQWQVVASHATRLPE
jgi:Domain of unknown function (DUF4440)